MFGKSATKAREMELLIRNREVQKEYVCRVVGEFPEGEVVCSEPIEIVSYKIGVCVVSKAGKECYTQFQRLSYKDGVSTVLCRPKSGRMHQIRVHLQFLGHPITNDPLYNSDIFGPEKGKGGNIGKSNEELIKDLIKFHTVENWINSDAFESSEAFDANLSDVKETIKDETVINDDEMKDKDMGEECERKSLKNEVSDKVGATEIEVKEEEKVVESSEFKDPHCQECQLEYKDPPPSTLVMYLHALRYSGPGWTFKTDLPSWAKLDNSAISG